MTVPAEETYPVPGLTAVKSDLCPDCQTDAFTCDSTGCNGRLNPGFRTRSLMSDREMLSTILENQVWLTTTLGGLLAQFENHPAFRMMMGRKR